MSPWILVTLGVLAIYLLYRWQKKEEPVVFTCPYCSATFNTYEELEQHILLEHPGDPIPPEPPPPEPPPDWREEPGRAGGNAPPPIAILVAAIGEDVEPYSGKIGHFIFGPQVIEGVIQHDAFGPYPVLYTGVETGNLYWYRRWGPGAEAFHQEVHWYRYNQGTAGYITG